MLLKLKQELFLTLALFRIFQDVCTSSQNRIPVSVLFYCAVAVSVLLSVGKAEGRRMRSLDSLSLLFFFSLYQLMKHQNQSDLRKFILVSSSKEEVHTARESWKQATKAGSWESGQEMDWGYELSRSAPSDDALAPARLHVLKDPWCPSQHHDLRTRSPNAWTYGTCLSFKSPYCPYW